MPYISVEKKSRGYRADGTPLKPPGAKRPGRKATGPTPGAKITLYMPPEMVAAIKARGGSKWVQRVISGHLAHVRDSDLAQ